MDPRPLVTAGLDVWGVADGKAWDRVLPGCRSVVVVGNGGRALWDAFVRHGPRPVRDPLDTFVREAVLALAPGDGGRWVFSAESPDVDFRTLAVAAGLGWPSRLGLVLHPVYGPWLGLRAAWFTRDQLDPTGPLAAPRPCEGCPAPCVAACPAGAVDRTLDIAACGKFREIEDACSTTCRARDVCPVGAEHRHPAEARRYHHLEAMN